LDATYVFDGQFIRKLNKSFNIVFFGCHTTARQTHTKGPPVIGTTTIEDDDDDDDDGKGDPLLNKKSKTVKKGNHCFLLTQ
jgi:hypothetical protein